MSHRKETTADTFWRYLWILVKLLLVLGLLGAILFAFVVWQISQAFPEIHAVPAPVAWVSRDVALSAEEPAARGRLVLTAPSAPSGAVRIGISAGAPGADAGTAPGVLLTGPRVLIRTELPYNQDSCYAPCELQIRPTWDCEPNGCRLVADVWLELQADTNPVAGLVTIGIAGGVTADLVGGLPSGIQTTLELDGDVAPGAS